MPLSKCGQTIVKSPSPGKRRDERSFSQQLFSY
jgi:hypothetical protein